MAGRIPPGLTFASIVAPVTPAEFFGKHWTREAVHLRDASRHFDDYFNWQALTTVLNAGDIAFPKIKVSRRDRPVAPDQFTVSAGGQALVDGRAVLGLFQDGASFGITGADSHWEPLRAVVDCLYDALLESVHTNVYCSPANTQGFQCHYDLHEVFVLQVSGEKHWRVFRPTSQWPVTSWRAEDSPHATQQPYVDVVLGPGDVLYVPRGHWHYAIAQYSASLHVTVGVTCRKGTAVLDWLTGELLQAAPWRRNVPLLADSTAAGRFSLPPEFGEWAEGLRRSLLEKIAEPALFERFCRDTLATIQPTHNVTFQNDQLPIDRLRFRRPPGRRHYFGSVPGDDGEVTVTVAGNEIQAQASDAELIRRIFDTEAFTLSDLRAWKPDLPIDEVSELLQELTRSGFLIATPS